MSAGIERGELRYVGCRELQKTSKGELLKYPRYNTPVNLPITFKKPCARVADVREGFEALAPFLYGNFRTSVFEIEIDLLDAERRSAFRGDNKINVSSADVCSGDTEGPAIREPSLSCLKNPFDQSYWYDNGFNSAPETVCYGGRHRCVVR